MSRILLYAGGGALIAAGLAIWFLWAHLQTAEAEAHRWEQSAKTAQAAAEANKKAVEAVQAEKEAAEAAAIARSQENAQLRQSEARLRSRLSQALQESSDEVQKCMALPVPESINDLLREYPDLRPPDRDGEDHPAEGTDAGLPGTSVGRWKHRGPARLHQVATERIAGV